MALLNMSDYGVEILGEDRASLSEVTSAEGVFHLRS